MKKEFIQIIENILKQEYITVHDISELTGLSRDRAQKLRKDVIKSNKDKFHYTSQSPIRLEHFLEYYNSRKLHSMYEDLFNIKSEYSHINKTYN